MDYEPFDFNRHIYGDKFANEKAAFEKRIEEIEIKYAHWFKDRPGKFPDQEYDKLNNHYIMQWDSNKISIGFNNDNELPAIIRNECIEAFKDIFDHE